MKIIRRDLLYLAGIAAQVPDACNRLPTLTRHRRSCMNVRVKHAPPNERVISWRLVQLLPFDYLHCDIDKEPMEAVS
jgi:hypothetical protein